MLGLVLVAAYSPPLRYLLLPSNRTPSMNPLYFQNRYPLSTSPVRKTKAALDLRRKLRMGWLTVLAMGASGSLVQAQQPTWQWQAQSAETRSAVLQRMTTDATGSVYVTGRFTGQLRLGTTRLVSRGRSDLFVAKLSAGGQWTWAVAAGSAETDQATDLALDATGNLLVTGSFEGKATFGNQEVVSHGGQDVFVAALTPQGKWQGVLTAGGPNQDEAFALTIDRDNNVLLGGRFQGDAVFGDHQLHAAAGGSDAFVVRLGPNGKWAWAKQVGATEQGAIRRIAVDKQGDIIVTGYVGGTGQFGAHPLTSQGTHNAFVAKLSNAGNWQWASGGFSESTTYSNALVVDEQNRIFVTGSYSGQATFGRHQLASQGGDDAYVARLSPAGAWDWVSNVQGSALETGYDLAINAAGVLHMVGTSSPMTGGLLGPLPNQGGLDIFLARLTDEGQWLNMEALGSSGRDEGSALALAPNGAVLVGGTFGFSESIVPQVFVGRFGFPAACTKRLQ